MSPLLVWLPIQLYWNILILSFLLGYRASHKAQGVNKCYTGQHTPGQLLTLCWTSSHWPLELLLAPLGKVLHKWKLLLWSKERNIPKYVLLHVAGITDVLKHLTLHRQVHGLMSGQLPPRDPSGLVSVKPKICVCIEKAWPSGVCYCVH